MKIYLDTIEEEGLHLKGEADGSILDLFGDSSVKDICPVLYNLNVSLVTDELLVCGSLEVTLSFRCSRCSDFFPHRVIEPKYNYNADVSDVPESVDLTEDIRVAMLLAFPSYPVCDSGCKGLCPHCGINLNNDKCKCKPPGDSRWVVLDNLEDIE